MKKVLLSSVALLGLTAGAMAADLPSRRAPAPYVPVPVFTWTGFYVGVNAGYGFMDKGNNNSTFIPAGTFAAPYAATSGYLVNSTGNRNKDGFVGGGQVGYNYQIGQFVVGIEADIQYADLGRNSKNAGSPTFVQTAGLGLPPGFVSSAYSRGGIDYFGTVRGRVGYAIDRLLVYGTGGFAYGGGDNNNTTSINRSSDNTRTGYAVGGGLEYAFTPNITGRIEGLYVSLDRNSSNNGYIGTTAAGVPVYVTSSSKKFDNDFGVVRAGLNYKFNTF